MITFSGESQTITLVDCPGHATLLRTIICGSRIVDGMMLVIYASKGIQTQTAECIVIGEVVNINHVLVVFNKIDLVNGASLRATEQKVLKTLARTKLQVFASVRVATAPREGNTLHKESLEQKLFQLVDSIPSQSSGSEERTTVVAVDHVFPIKGQGTVLTGTVLRGAVRVGMEVEFPTMARGFVKKVKTIRSFHRSVSVAAKGERVGLGIDKLESNIPERQFVASPPGAIDVFKVLIGSIFPVSYYRQPINQVHDQVSASRWT